MKVLGDVFIGRNDSKAFEWYSRAADKGNHMAECMLGWLYETGHGVKYSYDKALAAYGRNHSCSPGGVGPWNSCVDIDDRAEALRCFRKVCQKCAATKDSQ